VIMYFTEDSSASRYIPLEIEPITVAPSRADQTLPRPPKRLVPAITGPAIASSSRLLPPELWLTDSSRAAARMPPIAAIEGLIGVFWGTGVGGGLVLDGRPWLGRGAAGEIGHMVVKRGGAKCPCGRKGCMEAYAGRAAMEAEARRQHEEGVKTDLFKLMRKHERDRLTSGIWERAVDHNDQLATHLIDRAIEALGTGIASAVNLLDPEAVILGGGLGVRFGDRYMEPLTKEMGKHLFVDERPPAVRVVSLGDLGGAIGASLLVA